MLGNGSVLIWGLLKRGREGSRALEKVLSEPLSSICHTILPQRRQSYSLPALSGLAAVVKPDGRSSQGCAHPLLPSRYQPQQGPVSSSRPSSILPQDLPRSAPSAHTCSCQLFPQLASLTPSSVRGSPSTTHSSLCVVA